METHTFVGVDVSKTSIVATAVDALGHRVAQEKMSSEDSALIGFLDGLPGCRFSKFRTHLFAKLFTHATV